MSTAPKFDLNGDEIDSVARHRPLRLAYSKLERRLTSACLAKLDLEGGAWLIIFNAKIEPAKIGGHDATMP